MIKIEKSPKPQILADNAATWTQEYTSCLAAGKKPSDEVATRYNDPTIKRTLEKETHGKCAYCESKIKHISYGDIEHILPKNKNARPDLYVEWSNLTLSCEQCNRSGKRTYYDPQLPLINPYSDIPSQHLQDVGPLVVPVLGDNRAIVTEKVLKLNRAALVERRTERIMSVENLLQTWAKEQNPTVKIVLSNELHDEYGADKEFSSTIKSFLASRGFPVKGTPWWTTKIDE